MNRYINSFIKTKLTTLLLFIGFNIGFAQKTPLKLTSGYVWPEIKNVKISNDGKYVLYCLSSEKGGDTLIVQGTDNGWKKAFPEINGGTFTSDSKKLIYKSADGYLHIAVLDNDLDKILDKAVSYKMAECGPFLVYVGKDHVNQLNLLNLQTNKEQKFPNVIDYLFDPNGKLLIMQSVDTTTYATGNYDVSLLELKTGKLKIIGKGYKSSDFTFDNNGLQLAWLTETDPSKEQSKVLNYYRHNSDSVAILVQPFATPMEGMYLDNGLSFSKDGANLFFQVKRLDELNKFNNQSKKNAEANVTIWSSQDKMLREGGRSAYFNQSYKAVINLVNKYITLLTNDEQEFNEFGATYSNNAVIATHLIPDTFRIFFKGDAYLISTSTSKKKLIKAPYLCYTNFEFSRYGKYVTWYDRTKAQYFTYNVSNGITKCITKAILVPLFSNPTDYPGIPHPSQGIAGWLTDDQYVYIYDAWDIWQVDPEGIKPPVNITSGYGKQNHTILRVLHFDSNNPASFKSDSALLITAFDTKTKLNGFFKMKIGQDINKIKKTMLSGTYYFPPRYSPDYRDIDPVKPIKAKNAETYILRPTTTNQYPNLTVTRDFKVFKPLTHLEPQKSVNWYSTELIHFKLPDNSLEEGILYKPENFDPNKKYPVIFLYYERFADVLLNAYVQPALSSGCISIPWYVSNGYLVCVPDIKFKTGHPGESAFNAVNAAANYLVKLPWIDSTKMGLNGHSFGGYETNYIITRTSRFACAVAAAGMSDLVSSSGEIRGNSGTHEYYEETQGRMGASIWGRPDLYIENSPIFKADKVQTPLLMMNNSQDNVVRISQGYEWFTGLRRLGKKVWFLDYVNENHSLNEEKDQLDYSIRLSQFFGHYLKGEPMPEWMDNHVGK